MLQKNNINDVTKFIKLKWTYELFKNLLGEEKVFLIEVKGQNE